MTFFELLLIAIGLSMDAFAVAICKGLSLKKIKWKDALIVGLYFGIFQAAMPLAGFLIGSVFAGIIDKWDHWVAFTLLAIIGIKMIIESKKKGSCQSSEDNSQSLSFKQMLPLAIGTSIDALAAGVSFALLSIKIIPAVGFIGAVTLILSSAGVYIGNIFGCRFKSGAEITGGIILILTGLKILLSHLGVISF